MRKTRKGFGVVELFVAGTVIILLVIFYGVVTDSRQDETPDDVKALISDTKTDN